MARAGASSVSVYTIFGLLKRAMAMRADLADKIDLDGLMDVANMAVGGSGQIQVKFSEWVPVLYSPSLQWVLPGFNNQR